MPSLLTFNTTVFPVGDGSWDIRISTPLTKQATTEAGNTPAFTTEIKFTRDWTVRGSAKNHEYIVHRPWFVFSVKRTSTFIGRGTGKRMLKNGPVTTDTAEVYTTGVNVSSHTRWHAKGSKAGGRRYSQHHATATHWSTAGLDGVTSAALLGWIDGLKRTRTAEPFVDWVTESLSAVAPFFSEAGWLPATIRELDQVRMKRDLDHADAIRKMNEAASEFESENHDRWR